ncbi:hypothetical protein E2I00_012754, partial [Balaenoptera physalus]
GAAMLEYYSFADNGEINRTYEVNQGVLITHWTTGMSIVTSQQMSLELGDDRIIFFVPAPPPGGPTDNSMPSMAVNLVAAIFTAVIPAQDHSLGPGRDSYIPPAMFATEEQDPTQGDQDRADGGADRDPGLVEAPVVPLAEGSDEFSPELFWRRRSRRTGMSGQQSKRRTWRRGWRRRKRNRTTMARRKMSMKGKTITRRYRRRLPMAGFQSLFRDLIQSHHTRCRIVVRSCSPEPKDPGEGPISREGEDLAEGTSPQVPKELLSSRSKLSKTFRHNMHKVKAQFYKDLYDLEKKYAAFYQPLFDKKADIINAIHEPTEVEVRPEIISSAGCEIYWKDGKDLTVKTLKLQNCEGPGGVVPTSRKVPSSSFFTYFYPPDSPEGRVLDVATDYKLGYFFREVLIPKSILLFMKEAIKYQYENSVEEVQESEGEEEKEAENEEPEEGPEKDPNTVECSLEESRLNIIQPFLPYTCHSLKFSE